MGTLPAAGSPISMGRTGPAYYGGITGTSVSIGNTAPVQRLNAAISRSPTTTTAFSSVFGGRTTPYPY